MWISLLVSNVSLLNKLFSQKNILKKSNCFVFALKSERKECLKLRKGECSGSCHRILTRKCWCWFDYCIYIFCFWEVDAVAKERFKFHSCQSNTFVFGEANWLGMGSRGWVHYINNNVSKATSFYFLCLQCFSNSFLFTSICVTSLKEYKRFNFFFFAQASTTRKWTQKTRKVFSVKYTHP